MKRSMLATVALMAGLCARDVLAQEVGATGIVLCEASVKIGSRTVKTLVPGDCVHVAEIRGDWAGVSGDSPGWIARCAVGTPEQAIERFSQAVCQEPKNAAVYAARGNARLAAGQISAAITDYETALCLDRDYAPVRRQLTMARSSWESKNRLSSAPAAAGADDNVIESFDIKAGGIRGVDDLLLLPVMIGGREYAFLFDTGATMSVFDWSLKETLTATGNRVPINGGPNELPLYECRDATVGRSKIPLGTQALCFDLSRFQGEQTFWGIVGVDTLKKVVLQIDFDAGKIRFLKSSAGVPGEQLPLTFDHRGLPTVKVRLGGEPELPFALDTGAVTNDDCGVAWSKFWDLALTKPAELARGVRYMATLTGTEGSHVATVDRIVVGGFEHARPVIHDAATNYLGLGYLSRYLMTMDFPGGKLVLQKGKQFHRRYHPDRSGVVFEKTDGAFVVTRTEAWGWASASGIRADDRILELDGRDARELTYSGALHLLQEAHAEFVMKVQTQDDAPRILRIAIPLSTAQ